MTSDQYKTLSKAYELIGELLKAPISSTTLMDLPEKYSTLKSLELKVRTFYAEAPEISIPFNSDCRTENCCYYRTIFCYLARAYYNLEIKHIAEYLNRSTDQIKHYISLAKDYLEVNKDFNDQYERLKQTLV